MWLMAIFSKQCDPEMESLLLLAGLQIPAGQAVGSGNIQVQDRKTQGGCGRADWENVFWFFVRCNENP